MVVILQIVTIMISRGDVTFLANLYAFGVIWSFALKGIAVLVLRYTHPQDREFRVPLNFTYRRQGNSARPGADHADAAWHRHRESFHQAGGHRVGHYLLAACSSLGFELSEKSIQKQARQDATSNSISSIWRRKPI